MDEIEVETKQLPDGRTLVYTIDPSVVLVQPHPRPYGFTGVVNRAWIEASRAVGQQYTPRDVSAGWPKAMEPHRLACLQYPQDSTGQSYATTALVASCASGVMQHITFTRADYTGAGELLWEYTDCAIPAQDFAAWLALQGEEPSAHIVAWFKATGVTIAAPSAPAYETAPPAPVVANSASNEPLPLATGDIAFCFDGIRWSEQKWRKPLGDKPKWLQSCVVAPAHRGVSETRWNPVMIAAWLVDKGHAKQNSIRARFQTKPQLSPWLEAWRTYEADNFDTP